MHRRRQWYGQVTCHCTLEDQLGHRCVELPEWMLDSVRCAEFEVQDVPLVSWEALVELRSLLSAVGEAGDAAGLVEDPDLISSDDCIDEERR